MILLWMDATASEFGTISQSTVDAIKTAYKNSMEKWNNVYFYSNAFSGTIAKKKVINIVEGTSTDHDITIYPGVPREDYRVAQTFPTGDEYEINNGLILGEDEHKHYGEWGMLLFLDNFYYNEKTEGHGGYSYVNDVLSVTGAHEVGHILGLCDLDSACEGSDHHGEALMGYEFSASTKTNNITYKDIAGVSIIREFHTDNDHVWLNAGLVTGIYYTGNYKLICSICNGVKYVTEAELSDYTYVTYGSCNDNHALSSGNMMAVASYANTDYYKCKYCRYVAPFESNVTQNYTVTSYSDTQHKYTNNVNGLSYTFYEDHNMVNNTCSVCNYVHTHSYTYTYVDGRTHSASCACGNTKMENHSVLASTIIDGRYAKCIGCKRLLDLNNDNAFIIRAVEKVSINGSYILESGVVVLVDEDVAAYLDGTLQFYDKDKLPVTE